MAAFVTTFGKYEFTRMLFSLKNASVVFHSTMKEGAETSALQCCALYIDDMIVFSSCWGEHLDNLRALLSAISSKGVTIKLDKCSFEMNYIP